MGAQMCCTVESIAVEEDQRARIADQAIRQFKEKLERLREERREREARICQDAEKKDEAEYSGDEISSETSIADECIICFERVQNACFMPCKHSDFCDVCAFQLSTCPLCRASIEGITYIQSSNMFANVGSNKVVFQYVGHRTLTNNDMSERRRYYLAQVYPDF